MRALVTGATGLIGGHIVRALAGEGHQVRALVRANGTRPPPHHDRLVSYVTADVLQTSGPLETACADCDVVFHTAAQFAYGTADPAALHRLAVSGTEAMLHACARAGVRRVVVTSSSVVFGHSDDRTGRDEGSMLTPAGGEPAYVDAKVAQHLTAVELGERLGLDVRLACPAMTIGPTRSRLGPSNAMIVAYLADPFACTFPGGCNLVSARDVAAGHLLIAKHGVVGGSYLLGSENLSWPQIHAMIAELTGVTPPRLMLNHTLAFLAAAGEEVRAAGGGRPPLSTREQAAMLGRYYWYSHARAAALGYAPASARDAMVETVSWLAASPHISRETRAGMRLDGAVYRYRATALGSSA